MVTPLDIEQLGAGNEGGKLRARAADDIFGADGDIERLDPATGERTALIAGETWDFGGMFSRDGTRFTFGRLAADPSVVPDGELPPHAASSSRPALAPEPASTARRVGCASSGEDALRRSTTTSDLRACDSMPASVRDEGRRARRPVHRPTCGTSRTAFPLKHRVPRRAPRRGATRAPHPAEHPGPRPRTEPP